MMYDLTTIGEGQLRLTVAHGDRLASARDLRMAAAGSEANVAGLLAQLGRRTAWSTVLPIGDLSDRVLQEYRSVGVDTSHVIRTPTGRVALYFMEPGESPMPGKVLYDRHNTPFRTTTADHYDWEALLNTKAVFVTGITAALTETTAAVLYRLVDQADERGIEVILDVNHRTSLWSGDEAARTLAPIAEKAAMLFCSRTDAKAVFGIEGTGPEAARALRDRFGSRHVISTDQVNGVYVSSGDIGERQFDVERVPVVDRPGAGDAFVAGTIHGLLAGDLLAGIGCGQRAASFALTHHGDLTHIAVPDLDIPHTTDIVR